MIWAPLLPRGLHVLNRFSRMQSHICQTCMAAGGVTRSTVDYLIINGKALQKVELATILDRPHHQPARNFHSHLLLQLYSHSKSSSSQQNGTTKFRWNPGCKSQAWDKQLTIRSNSEQFTIHVAVNRSNRIVNCLTIFITYHIHARVIDSNPNKHNLNYKFVATIYTAYIIVSYFGFSFACSCGCRY